MKNILLAVSLALIAAICRLSAQTNALSPESRKGMKEADFRRFFQTNEWPIQTSLTWNKEAGCQIFYWGHTNIVVYDPIPEQQFDFRLFSMDGREIPKTDNYKFGKKLQPDKRLLAGDYSIQDDVIRGHERRYDFKNGNSSHFWRFDILKSFRIKKTGEYRLQVEVRLFTKDTNGVFQPFLLPPVETKVNISESELGK